MPSSRSVKAVDSRDRSGPRGPLLVAHTVRRRRPRMLFPRRGATSESRRRRRLSRLLRKDVGFRWAYYQPMPRPTPPEVSPPLIAAPKVRAALGLRLREKPTDIAPCPLYPPTPTPSRLSPLTPWVLKAICDIAAPMAPTLFRRSLRLLKR